MAHWRRHILLLGPLLAWLSLEVDFIGYTLLVGALLYLPLFLSSQFGKTAPQKLGIFLVLLALSAFGFSVYSRGSDGMELLYLVGSQIYFLIWAGVVKGISYLPPIQRLGERTKNALAWFVLAALVALVALARLGR